MKDKSLKFLDDMVNFPRFCPCIKPLNGSTCWVNVHGFKGERRKSTECHILKEQR